MSFMGEIRGEGDLEPGETFGEGEWGADSDPPDSSELYEELPRSSDVPSQTQLG